jgi:hypothetical protein
VSAPYLHEHTRALLWSMVIWDAFETATGSPEYGACCSLTRRGLAARIGKRGRSGRVWFEPTDAGRDVVLRPSPWTKLFERMGPPRGMPAPILRESYEDRGWFEDLTEEQL